MRLFRGYKDAVEIRRVLDSYRGQLNAQLWETDRGHTAYLERSLELEADVARVNLASRRPRYALSSGQRKRIDQMRQGVAPDSAFPAGASLLEDASNSAFLLCCAEDWSDVDTETLSNLVDGCCAEASLDGIAAESSFRRITVATASMIARHANPDAQPQASRLLYDYVAALPAFGRLMELGRCRARLDNSAFLTQSDQFELLYERAWHAGIACWLFEEAFSPLRTIQFDVLGARTS